MKTEVIVHKIQHAVIDLRDRLPRLTIVVVITLLVQIIIVFAALVFFDRFMGQENTGDRFDDSVQTTRNFKPGQAVTLSLGTVIVYVPPFALPLPGSIFVSVRDGDLSPIANYPEWSHPQVVDVHFQDLEGTALPEIILSVPIKICFKLTKTQWQKHAGRPDSFAIQYYGLKKGESVWLNLPVAKHPDRLQMCAQTNHLSLFALALKSESNIPVTGSTATAEPTEAPTQPAPLFVNDLSGDTRARKNEPDPEVQQPTSVTPADLPQQRSTNISPSAATPTRTPHPTATRRPTSTATRRPTSTATQRPASTATRRPTSTATPRPVSTATQRPTSTATRRPTSTSTQRPASTATRRPTSTATPRPVSTATQRPTSTATRRPTSTATPRPVSTATQRPTSTATQRPTSTALSPTPLRPTPTPTINPPTPTSPPPTNPPPTDPPTPTRPPPTSPAPTNPLPTNAPTPTRPPPTSPPPTIPPTSTSAPPTEPPPTEPPPTDPPPTEPPPTVPPPTEPPPTDPPPSEPPPTNPPPTEPPPTEPPPTEPQPTEPQPTEPPAGDTSTLLGNTGNWGNFFKRHLP